MKNLKKTAIFFIFLIILGFGAIQTSLAIGQMTKPILIEDILRSQEVTATLYLVNSEDKEAIFQLRTDGEIADWASFYKIDDENLESPITEISIPPQSKIEVIVKFTIPEDTPNGEYSGEVAIISAPTKEEGAGKMMVGVGERIGRYVSITVTDKEIIELEATIIPLEYGVNAGDPLKIKIIYDNYGNVALKPDVQLKILKDGTTVFNAIFPYPEEEEAVKVRTRKVMPLIEWPTAGQSNGKYQAEVDILYKGKVLAEDDFRFTIGSFSTSTLDKFLAAITFIGGGNIIYGWFVLGTLLLILAGIMTFLTKKQIPIKIRIRNRKRGRNNKRLNDISKT